MIKILLSLFVVGGLLAVDDVNTTEVSIENVSSGKRSVGIQVLSKEINALDFVFDTFCASGGQNEMVCKQLKKLRDFYVSFDVVDEQYKQLFSSDAWSCFVIAQTQELEELYLELLVHKKQKPDKNFIEENFNKIDGLIGIDLKNSKNEHENKIYDIIAIETRNYDIVLEHENTKKIVRLGKTFSKRDVIEHLMKLTELNLEFLKRTVEQHSVIINRENEEARYQRSLVDYYQESTNAFSNAYFNAGQKKALKTISGNSRDKFYKIQENFDDYVLSFEKICYKNILMSRFDLANN